MAREAGGKPVRVGDEPVQRRYDLSATTGLFIMTAVFLAVGAINSQNNLLFWAFGVAVGGLVVSGLTSGSGLMGVRLERVPPGPGRVGRGVEIRYRVRSTSRWMPAFGLIIRERAVFAGADGERPLTIETGLTHVPAGGVANAVSRFVPRGRGVLELGRVEVTSTAPFGLLRKTLVFDLPTAVEVGPRAVRLRATVSAPSGQTVSSHRPIAARVGSGDEFYGLRSYVPGDSPRLIAWRPSARQGSLVIRQMIPPVPPRCVVRLAEFDASTPVHLRERAIALAGAVVERAAEAGMSVGLEAAWAGVRVPRATGRQVAESALRALARVGTASADTAVPGIDEPRGVGIVRVVAESGGESNGERGVVTLAADRPGEWLSGDGLGEDLEEVTPAGAGDRRVWRRIGSWATRAGDAIGFAGRGAAS